MIDKRLLWLCEKLGIIKLSPCTFCDGKGVTNSQNVQCPLCKGSGSLTPFSSMDIRRRLERWAWMDDARRRHWQIELQLYCRHEFGLPAWQSYPALLPIMLPETSRIKAILQVANKEAQP